MRSGIRMLLARVTRRGRAEVLAGRFRVEATVARSTAGPVLRAVDDQDGRSIVLKVLSPAVVGSGDLVGRLDAELRAAAAVSHPGLAELRGWGTLRDGRPWVAAGWIGGEDLRTRLVRGALEPKEAQAVVEQLADALDAVHAAGQVHGAIHPGNVLLRPTPAGPRVWLTDLGTARALLGARVASVGTAGAPTADARTELGGPGGRAADRHGLACVAFAALTGTPPAAPPPPATAPPAAVDAVLAAGLAPDPADRPTTASAFARDLARALGLPPAPADVGTRG